MAEVDYGSRDYWYNTDDVDNDINGNIVNGSSPREKWVNKYLVPYMKVIKVDTDELGRPTIYLADGGIVHCSHESSLMDWVVYIEEPKKCHNRHISFGNCAFRFNYAPPLHYNDNAFKYIGKNFEPYKYMWDGTLDKLYSGGYLGCNETSQGYCTALIQYYGWKIPKNYPIKF